MARFNRTKREDIGLAPDTFLYRGKERTESTEFSLIQYDVSELEESSPKGLSNYKNKSERVNWLNINGVHEAKLMREIGERFDLQPSVVGDIMNTHARPRIQNIKGSLYVSLKMLRFEENINEIFSENLVLILNDNELITFQEVKGDVFELIRTRIRKKQGKIRTESAHYLFLALLDVVIDNYNFIISRIGDKIDIIDEQLLDNVSVNPEEDIYSLKSEIIYMNRALKPCREMLNNLVKKDTADKKISEGTLDLINNINHASDALESYRELLSEQLNYTQTIANNELNQTMKFLTVFSVIFIPLTFIAGIYGTNFAHIPELQMANGYYYMWGLMIIVAVIMVFYFKRKKWL